MKTLALSLLLLILAIAATAQDATYRYQLDLTNVQNDELTVTLTTPEISDKSTTFYMPNIIPGTYMESNYGMFVSDLKAYNKRGRELPVERLDDNSWRIEKSHKMTKLTYRVEDIYDSEQENKVYRMAGTNIADSLNFVIHTPGFFGYFEEMKEVPFEVSITRPADFYGSTGLIPVERTETSDLFRTEEYDLLMDSPIMYNRPDTTTIRVANAEVLISVWSPNGVMTSEYIAGKYEPLLSAYADYLGGQLPVEKYAFIHYFEEPAKASPLAGALEHSYSSFYYLPEYGPQQLGQTLVDIAAHEFYHIVTPLTLHAEEIEYFNYKEPDLSEHLWLYEGVTEYSAHHVQVRHQLISDQQFVNTLEAKVNNSRSNYNDTLSFTRMSELAAGEYNSQYGNVYQKGALIGALLDILIIDQTEGEKDLQTVIQELSARYGKNDPFRDEALFGEIAGLTTPAVGAFLNRYVAGTEPLPLDSLLGMAGVDFMKEEDTQVATLGSVRLGYNQEEGRLMFADVSSMNAFGEEMGYMEGDLFLKLQGEEVTPQNARQLLDAYNQNTQEGDTVRVVVGRLNDADEYEEITLSAPAFLVTREGSYSLNLTPEPTYEQLKLRNRWLTRDGLTARPEDVESVDAIIGALYDVISGPAGERDWDRFASLFKPRALMTAFSPNQEGEQTYRVMTPADYRELNGPFFMQNGFWEEEIGREVFQFGEIATVITAYQFRLEEEGEPAQRGVNSVQLVKDGGRWWVTNITWTTEREGVAIPEELLEGEETDN